ncbi:Kdo2-lipid IVA lauroyltransferase/acyltransferase [Gammaproteobacteria bacterium]
MQIKIRTLHEQALIFLLRLLAVLPLRVLHGIGGFLGGCSFLFSNSAKRVVEVNLRLCFPDLKEADLQSLIRKTLIESGKTMTEIGALWFWETYAVLKKVKNISGEEEFQTALKKGYGIIAAGPHLGAWEVAGLYLASRYSMTTLFRPPRLTGLGEEVRKARSRNGANLVPTDASGVKALHEALVQGKIAVILPDHNPGQGKGVFTPFFGIPTNTMVLLPRLAAKHHAPVYFVYAERLPQGKGFHIHFVAGETCIGSSDTVEGCACLNQGLEICIRRQPEQYQWGYKRFKVRPGGGSDFYA